MPARSHHEAGFTLVEILAVLIIIGLMSAVVILSIPRPDSPLKKQAQLMTGHINQLAQNGIISGRVGAVGISKDGYALYNYQDQDWHEIISGEWDRGSRVRFKRENKNLELPKEITPIILFQPTGLSTAFELSLSDGGAQYIISGQGDGRVALRVDE